MTESVPPSVQDPSDKSRTALKWLLLGIGFVLFATMPRWIYIGDPVQMRAGTIELITHGTFEIPAERAESSGERGHYFCQHPVNGRWYSKYGMANSLLYVPPLAIEYLQTGRLPHFEELSHAEMANRCFVLNLYNIALALVLAAYLYHLALLYVPRVGSAIVFVLLNFFATFLWYYLRAQTVEIFQVLFFSAAFYHLVRTHRLLRGRSLRERAILTGTHFRGAKSHVSREQLRQGFWALTWLSLLCLEKQVYVLLLPVTVSFLLVSMLGNATPASELLSRVPRGMLREWKTTAAICLPAGLTLALALGHNWYCFGSPFSTGYHQYEREKPILSWHLEAGLYGFLMDPQKSVFLYFPLIVAAMVRFRSFLKKHAFEWSFVLIAVAIYYPLNSAFSVWRGGWCYGPRYLLFVMPALSLPLLELLDRRALTLGWSRISSIVVASLVIWSLVTQPLIQGLEFFAFYRAHDPFMIGIHEPRIDEYFRQPFWIVNRDLVRYRTGRAAFRPLELARERYPEAAVARIERDLRSFPLGNIYWLVPRLTESTPGQSASAPQH
ncbi:MAG: hypothetical protein O3C40_32355 [Planctomycetota bacterium]|nr:hypothetical protein [Planctomycetota bacterium]